MPALKVLLEIKTAEPNPFELHSSAVESAAEAERQATGILAELSGLGLEIDDDAAPVPMFSGAGDAPSLFDAFGPRSGASPEGPSPADLQAMRATSASSYVVQAEITRERKAELEENDAVTVWPNSELTLIDSSIDLARSSGGLDCRPFRPGVEIEVIREMLGTEHVWGDGARGQNIVVGILDEGVDGSTYPVIGGFARPTAGKQPGAAAVTSHGSMCAADIMIAAPAARLYDYPFLGVPRSGGAIQMMQAALDQFTLDGTPQITNNSYGFTGIPDQASFPNHEVHDINHPYNRKVREVVEAGIACFFAAGNCGENCPSGNCHFSGIGPGNSIHAANSLEAVITVAAVNSRHERIGYSSQGPGRFHARKPDIASYSHFFANFGPDRPGGLSQPFDNGTSAATPVAAGVGAALLSAFPGTTPGELKAALMDTATSLGRVVGWDDNHGAGVINLAAAYRHLRSRGVPIA